MAKVVSLVVANFKGGCGKTTLAFHVAHAADQRGIDVLAIDTDDQGDLYRRFSGKAERSVDRPVLQWGARRSSVALYSPGAWQVPATPARLLVVDTPPALNWPAGPVPDALLIPLDGIDAALNANETIGAARAAGVRKIVLVRNGTSEGGKKQGREFADLGAGLQRGEVLCEVELPRGASIKRSSLSCLPAWSDVYKGADTRAMVAVCDQVLSHLGF